MEQIVSQFRRWWTHSPVRHHGRKVGVGASFLLVGWIGGTLVVGAVNHPTSLNAAISENSAVSSSATLDSMRNPGFSEIAKVVRPAVVHIKVVKEMPEAMSDEPFGSMREFWEKKFFENPRQPHSFKEPRAMGMGSGVIVSPDGHVVTNHHVVDGASIVQVTLLDKREFKGKVIGSDPQTDLAIVKIEGDNFPHLKWGDSSSLQVGDYVLAVGHPFGLTATVTQGIVSALGRGGMGITQYEDFIQTDAAINPGNSGGALVNARGELVGINTAIFSRTGGYQGVGFAVPTDLAKPVYAGIRKNGKVVRGFLGVGIQEVTPDLANTFQLKESMGALVTDVRSGSPAEKAGIQRGDVIVKFQGNSISDPRGLQKEVLRTPVETSVSILVVRDGQEQELRTKIVEQPINVELAQADRNTEDHGLAGIRVEPVNSRTARELGVESKVEGVVVTAVAPGSPADRAGVSRGDVIREVNRHTITSLDDYKHVAQSVKEGDVALLFIERSGVPLFLTVKV